MTMSEEWAGAKPRWHIQEHRREGGVGPSGPSHWAKRDPGYGNITDGIAPRPQGMKHAYDPPTAYVPLTGRDTVWRPSGRYLEPFKHEQDRATGTKRVSHPIPVDHMGWTGKFANYTGPRHFQQASTELVPGTGYGVEKVMGMKKFVMSKTMGLEGIYDADERRCLRPAVEWSLDAKLQRKIRVVDLEDRRNGIGCANPGDKGYATAEHAPEYAAMVIAENRSRGNMSRKVMSKIDASWSQSGADPLLDKKGRRMCDYIQIYCKTLYRKNSMYVHRNASFAEVAEMAGEGGSRPQHVFFKGSLMDPAKKLLESGVRAKCTLELVVEPEVIKRKPQFAELERTRQAMDEDLAVTQLNTLDLEAKFPASEREDYAPEEGEAAE
jgi:hypothetical protein